MEVDIFRRGEPEKVCKYEVTKRPVRLAREEVAEGSDGLVLGLQVGTCEQMQGRVNRCTDGERGGGRRECWEKAGDGGRRRAMRAKAEEGGRWRALARDGGQWREMAGDGGRWCEMAGDARTFKWVSRWSIAYAASTLVVGGVSGRDTAGGALGPDVPLSAVAAALEAAVEAAVEAAAAGAALAAAGDALEVGLAGVPPPAAAAVAPAAPAAPAAAVAAAAAAAPSSISIASALGTATSSSSSFGNSPGGWEVRRRR